MPISLDLMPLEEKTPEPALPKTIVVRYGYMRQVGEFASELTVKVGCGSKLVCRTERGTEICEMLTTTCSNGGCGKSVTREKMLEYIQNSGGAEYPFSGEGRVLRVATLQDLAEQEKLNESRNKDLMLARELVGRHHLLMKIVEVEYLLGRERVMFYFTSEHRVDFRQLVRDLAHQLRTRIELRQVGARDEARLTADYEKCGQHCCCKQFLKVLTPISMRSAKVQKATLDPAKISGRCGRLMCCLRYEDQTYEELRKKLPKRNTRVKTEKGEAWVVDGQILTQLVLLQYDDGKREATPMELIQAFDLPRPKLPNGVTMQSPNDRMPEPRGEAAPREGRPKNGVPRRGPGGGPAGTAGPGGGPHGNGKHEGPREGGKGRGPVSPAPPKGNRPLPRPPQRGGKPPLPADAGPAAGPPLDEIDEMIADALDNGPATPKQPPESVSTTDATAQSSPPVTPPNPTAASSEPPPPPPPAEPRQEPPDEPKNA